MHITAISSNSKNILENISYFKLITLLETNFVEMG